MTPRHPPNRGTAYTRQALGDMLQAAPVGAVAGVEHIGATGRVSVPRPALEFTHAEREAALQVAADVLRNAAQSWQLPCVVEHGGQPYEAWASFEWPGRVRVSLRYTGQHIATSLPGEPSTMASTPLTPCDLDLRPLVVLSECALVAGDDGLKFPSLHPAGAAKPPELAPAVAWWLHANRTRFWPMAAADDLDNALISGQYIGAYTTDGVGGAPSRYLVTPMALATIIAMVGGASATTKELDRRMVELGRSAMQFAPRRVRCALPGGAEATFYVLNAPKFDA